MDSRVRAAELYVKALRTGEASATAAVAELLAPDVVLDTVGAHAWGNGPEHVEGYDAVLNMVTSIGVMTGVYRTGAWATPELSGSTQVYPDTQLSIWVRHANGGMIKALQKNPNMVLMYRDPPNRTTLTFQGRGHVDSSEDVRSRVFDLAPEVEQRHDLERNGAALIIDIDRVTGSSPRGGVRMVRQS